MGDKAGALRDLKEIAGELADKGRQAEAIDVLREAATLNPDDEEIREQLFDVYFAAGELRARARVRDDASSSSGWSPRRSRPQGSADEALETLRQAAALERRQTPS